MHIATWLLAHGAIDQLTHARTVRRLPAPLHGDRAAAQALQGASNLAHGAAASARNTTCCSHRPAENGNAAVLETILVVVWIRRQRRRQGPRDAAASAPRWADTPEAARVLLAHGAAVNVLDGMFAATPLVWAVEGRGTTKRDGRGTSSPSRTLLDRRRLIAGVDSAGWRTGTRADLGRIDGVEAVGRSCSDDVTSR